MTQGNKLTNEIENLVRLIIEQDYPREKWGRLFLMLKKVLKGRMFRGIAR